MIFLGFPRLSWAHPTIFLGFPKPSSNHPTIFFGFPRHFRAYPMIFFGFPRLSWAHPTIFLGFPRLSLNHPMKFFGFPRHFRTHPMIFLGSPRLSWAHPIIFLDSLYLSSTYRMVFSRLPQAFLNPPDDLFFVCPGLSRTHPTISSPPLDFPVFWHPDCFFGTSPMISAGPLQGSNRGPAKVFPNKNVHSAPSFSFVHFGGIFGLIQTLTGHKKMIKKLCGR